MPFNLNTYDFYDIINNKDLLHLLVDKDLNNFNIFTKYIYPDYMSFEYKTNQFKIIILKTHPVYQRNRYIAFYNLAYFELNSKNKNSKWKLVNNKHWVDFSISSYQFDPNYDLKNLDVDKLYKIQNRLFNLFFNKNYDSFLDDINKFNQLRGNLFPYLSLYNGSKGFQSPELLKIMNMFEIPKNNIEIIRIKLTNNNNKIELDFNNILGFRLKNNNKTLGQIPNPKPNILYLKAHPYLIAHYKYKNKINLNKIFEIEDNNLINNNLRKRNDLIMPHYLFFNIFKDKIPHLDIYTEYAHKLSKIKTEKINRYLYGKDSFLLQSILICLKITGTNSGSKEKIIFLKINLEKGIIDKYQEVPICTALAPPSEMAGDKLNNNTEIEKKLLNEFIHFLFYKVLIDFHLDTVWLNRFKQKLNLFKNNEDYFNNEKHDFLTSDRELFHYLFLFNNDCNFLDTSIDPISFLIERNFVLIDMIKMSNNLPGIIWDFFNVIKNNPNWDTDIIISHFNNLVKSRINNIIKK